MTRDEQRAREMAEQQYGKEVVEFADSVTEMFEHKSEYEPVSLRAIAALVAALLASRALEEAKWWAKNGTHGFITDEAVERITELEQAAASKAAGGSHD